MRCHICENRCVIRPGGTGLCRMYINEGGRIVERFPDHYIATMPIAIETMPMCHYHPRETFLQVSGIGCTFSCGGCISETIAHHAEAVSGALRHIPPDALVRRAQKEECRGIAFCLNDPTAMHQTFLRVARSAHDAGLLIGCATNGYYTEESLRDLSSAVDFANIGLKGASDACYRACGAASSGPAFETVRTLFETGAHVEVSCIYARGSEDELRAAAVRVADVSPDIPFQVMRFIPFGDEPPEREPTIAESERICDELRQTLSYVYLFNSPGTEYLNMACPSCGETVIRREFFGPMGARTIVIPPEARCSCGFSLPIVGNVGETSYAEPGMMGGYRFTRALEMIHAILVCLGVESDADLARIWAGVIKDDYIRDLHGKIQRIDTYLDLIREVGERADRMEAAEKLTSYIRDQVAVVSSAVEGCSRPRVYYSMGTPLFALNADRFEMDLVEAAGGDPVNRGIERAGKPGVNITPEEFVAFDPEYIFISGFLSAPVSDYLAACRRMGLSADAIEAGRVYTMPPGWDFGNPRWVLGLSAIAGTLHPAHARFDLNAEQDRFYRTFYGTGAAGVSGNRSFYRP
ncbi:MAG: radical SAM protein [Methanoculleus sp.]|nr:radical SAM protein [Methanoculleus sp.]